MYADFLENVPKVNGTRNSSSFGVSELSKNFSDSDIDDSLSGEERTKVMMTMFDAFSPELNLEDTLVLLIDKFSDLVQVEQVRFYWPIDPNSKKMTLRSSKNPISDVKKSFFSDSTRVRLWFVAYVICIL